MGVFDKFDKKDIERAEGFSKTPNMDQPGKGLVRIRRHSIGTSQRNKNRIKFVCEYEIEEAADTWTKHRNGAQRSYVTMIDPAEDDKAKSKLGAIKVHLEAVSGVDQSEIDQDFLNDLEAHPFKYEGTLVWLEVCDQIKLKSGNDFTPQNWYPYEEEDDEAESAGDQTSTGEKTSGASPF